MPEIEYKINANDQLVIKQARPWATYWAGNVPPTDSINYPNDLNAYPNPFHDVLQLDCVCETILFVEIYNIVGQKTVETSIDFRKSQRTLVLSELSAGVYFLRGYDGQGAQYFSGKLVKM